MKRILLSSLVATTVLAAPVMAARLTGVADCTASSRTIIVGLNNDTSTISSFIVSQGGVPYSLSAAQYTKTASSSGEPNTIVMTTAAVTAMSNDGVTFGDSSKVKIVTGNNTFAFDCE